MTEQPKLFVGTDDFKALLLNSNVFVDKSLMIKELLEDPGAIVLITRPRRWGKTLNMSMVRRFLEIEVDAHGYPLSLEQSDNRKLFLGGTIDLGFDETKELQPLKIALHKNTIKRQGQFPVIFITFKSVEGSSYQKIEQGVKTQIRKLFQAYRYLANSLEPDERAQFNRYLAGEITLDFVEDSLSLLSKLLYKYYNKKVWVLIDEYDTPINSAYRYFGKDEAAFESVIALFRGIMKAVFKQETGDQEFPIERGVITGILRIAKAELFSGLNNVSEYSLLDENFAKYYGFTQAEVDELLTKVPTHTDPEQVKNWYNGYTFGGEIIYNPWSIMQCLSHKGKLEHYWIDSGGTAFIDKVLVSDEIQGDIQELLEGQGILKKLYKQISLGDIHSNKDIFYSLLVFAGYLNPWLANDDEEQPKYRLTIPNKEVRGIYVERVLNWLSKKLNIGSDDYDDFIALLIHQQIDQFGTKLQEYLLHSTSYHDLSKEKDYHNLMGGLLAPLASKYTIASNKEIGYGRCDHVLIPIVGRGDHAIIIEYKIAKSKEELPALAKAGLEQIHNKQYDTQIKQQTHVTKISKLSMAFCGKEVVWNYEVSSGDVPQSVCAPK